MLNPFTLGHRDIPGRLLEQGRISWGGPLRPAAPVLGPGEPICEEQSPVPLPGVFADAPLVGTANLGGEVQGWARLAGSLEQKEGLGDRQVLAGGAATNSGTLLEGRQGILERLLGQGIEGGEVEIGVAVRAPGIMMLSL